MAIYIDFYPADEPEIIAVDTENCDATLVLGTEPTVLRVPEGMSSARILSNESFCLSVSAAEEEFLVIDDGGSFVDLIRSVQAGGYIIARAQGATDA